MEEDNEIKNKQIGFPKFILDKLDEYKQETGINPTDYIRTALIRQMVVDKLIFFKTRYIEIKKIHEEKSITPPEGAKFCDGDKCELPIKEEK